MLCVSDCIIRSVVFFFKQKTAYEMRISDWSSDVCSSDLSGLDTEARALWKGLINVAKEVRLRSGTIAIPDLLSLFRGQFGLRHHPDFEDRKSVVEGKCVSVRVDLGGRRILKTKNLRMTNN